MRAGQRVVIERVVDRKLTAGCELQYGAADYEDVAGGTRQLFIADAAIDSLIIWR